MHLWDHPDTQVLLQALPSQWVLQGFCQTQLSRAIFSWVEVLLLVYILGDWVELICFQSIKYIRDWGQQQGTGGRKRVVKQFWSNWDRFSLLSGFSPSRGNWDFSWMRWTEVWLPGGSSHRRGRGVLGGGLSSSILFFIPGLLFPRIGRAVHAAASFFTAHWMASYKNCMVSAVERYHVLLLTCCVAQCGV